MIQLKSIEHNYIRIYKDLIFQAMGLSTELDLSTLGKTRV